MSALLPAPTPSASDDAPEADAATRFEVEGLVYRFDRPPRPHGRRSVVTVRLAEQARAAGFTDRLDLYAFKGRQAFARRVADAFGRQAGDVLGHLAVVLDAVERARRAAAASAPDPAALTPERRAAAEELLAAPDLLERAAAACEALGYVGEEATKRLAYLVATSRLLPGPLSAILRAPSGCGKSELLDVVARLLPEEAVEFLSRLTQQALYYAGADHLRHKLVLVDEQAGAAEADYPIRTLQSKGLLRLAVPLKGRTEPFTVHGPIALMSGTTSADLNPENLSRCLELALDDSPAQTRRIQEAQRLAATGGAGPPLDVTPWRDAQRLLEALPVVIPYASRLTFPARTAHDRRGNRKLLGLVEAHALLHQRRRARDERGRVVATPADYRAAFDLLRPVVAHDLDGLSPRAARLYRALAAGEVEVEGASESAGEAEAEARTRRDVARALGWSYATARRALDELLGQELVSVADRGPPVRYRLLDRSALGAAGADLLDPDALEALEA